MCHPEIELKNPVLDWKPGDEVPNFDRVAWRLKTRWKESPVRTKIVWASNKARAKLDGCVGGREPRADEILHDIHVAELCQLLGPENWTGEDELRGSGRSGDIPDALIALPEGDVTIDFGGSYSAPKLREMHHAYAPHGSYQLW